MDLTKQYPECVAYRAKSEKYAKIISKTIILSGMDATSFGQNAYFYDAAEGLLTATILLVAEFGKPSERHIVSVFKIIQELLAPSGVKGKNQFQILIDQLPDQSIMLFLELKSVAIFNRYNYGVFIINRFTSFI